MIQDSIPWKDELIAVAERLRRKTTQKRWTERSGFLVERDLMVSAYSLRKLIDNHKVSDSLTQRQFMLERFELLEQGRVPGLLSRDALQDFYDLKNPFKTVLPLEKVCNQIVHSWLWMLSFRESDSMFDGVYVSSDTARRKCLYRIPIDGYIDVCHEIGDEVVYETRMRNGPDGRLVYDAILGKPYSEWASGE